MLLIFGTIPNMHHNLTVILKLRGIIQYRTYGYIAEITFFSRNL
jgi:hypothetical protein